MRGSSTVRRTEALLALALGLLLLAASQPTSPAAGFSVRALGGTYSVTIQPGPANGSDTSILSLTPTWNYGNAIQLTVGPNATTGNLARSLLAFNVGGVPSNATVLNATLGLYETQGTSGTVQARAATSAWTAGAGGHSWTVVPVTVRETAGVNRTLEPAQVTVPFQPNSIADPARDLRVYLNGAEVPSQVYNYRFSGGQITSADVFFDVTVRANLAETFQVVYSTNGTGIPAYRTRTFSPGTVCTYGPTGGGASGVTVADIDNDGHLEMVFGGTDGYVYALTDRCTLKWSKQLSTAQSIPFTPQVADMDRSGKDSVVVVTNDPSIVRLNSTGSVVWRYNASAVLFTTGTFVDVNGDGVLDVLAGGNFKQIIAVNGRDGTLLRTYSVPLAGYTATIADIDGSGQPEILFTGDDKAVHAIALDGTPLWTAAPPGASFLEGSIAYGDINGDGVAEVVTGDNGNNGLEFALRALDGAVVWSAQLPSYREGGQSLADLNGDGLLETAVGITSGPMYLLRGTDGSTYWTYSGGTVQAGSPAFADLRRTGYPDVVFLQGTALSVVDRSGLPIHSWTVTVPNLNLRNAVQYPMTSPALADLTGNGTLDIIIPTATGIAVYSTGGLDHDWRTWGYNLRHTQRFLDGASGGNMPFLQVSLGSAVVHPADGASWNYADGVRPWSTAGGDFGVALASSTAAPGWMRWNLTALVQGWVSGAIPNDGLFLTEGSEVTGTVHAFVSSDGAVAAQRPVLTIAYLLPAPGTAGPVIAGPIPDVSKAENSPPWTLQLSGYAIDLTTPATQLRWNVTGFDPNVFQIAGLNVPGNMNLTVVPQANAWGSNHVTYWLTDPQGRFDTQTAWINLTPVNQAPTFNPPGALYVHYNVSYTFGFGPYISDPDTPAPQLVLTTDDPVHATASGLNVTFLYPESYLNRWTFLNLTVSDGQYAVTRTIAIRVTSDFPPVLSRALPNLTMLEGQYLTDVFNLRDYFTDPNNDALFYSLGYTHLNVTILADGSVNLASPMGWWGTEAITFRATDPTGAIAEDTIFVTVLHVDAPPYLGSVPDLRVRYDTAFTFNLDPYISDPDTPSSLLRVTASDTHVYVSGHLLVFLYPFAYNGTVQNVTLSVSDGIYSMSRTIRVSVGSDYPPVLLKKMPDDSFLEGTVKRDAYDLPQYFGDPDGSNLYWSSGNRSVLVTIHANGSVDLAAVPGWTGTEQVTFRATDGAGALQEDTVRITVIPVDEAPFFRPVPEQVFNTTTAYLPLGPYIGDPDTNLSQLVLVGTNSSHARILGQGILFNYSADTMDYVRVTVSDGNLTNATTIVVRVVLPVAGWTVREVLPAWVYWTPLPASVAAGVGFVLYRRRKLEWAFLVTNAGILVGSIARKGPSTLDTDLLTGMLTTIMDFAKQSFSEEGAERNLEGLTLGEKRVAIVKGEKSYLAVVYRGRTPGGLIGIMRSLIEQIERDHADALGDVVDTSKLGDIPNLLEKLVSRGSFPAFFVNFHEKRAHHA